VRVDSQYLRYLARKTRKSLSPKIQALKQLIIINHRKGGSPAANDDDVSTDANLAHEPGSLGALLDSPGLFEGLDILGEFGVLVANEAR
jgi:hypothetical protein